MDEKLYLKCLEIIKNIDAKICLIGGAASSIYTQIYLGTLGPISDVDMILMLDPIEETPGTREYIRYRNEMSFLDLLTKISRKYGRSLDWTMKGMAYSIYDGSLHLYDVLISNPRDIIILDGYPVLPIQDLISTLSEYITIFKADEKEMRYVFSEKKMMIEQAKNNRHQMRLKLLQDIICNFL